MNESKCLFGIDGQSKEVTHYGIKGQKWGIRRFQNADGSLTEAGQKRYSTLSKEEKKAMKVSGSSRVAYENKLAKDLGKKASLDAAVYKRAKAEYSKNKNEAKKRLEKDPEMNDLKTRNSIEKAIKSKRALNESESRKDTSLNIVSEHTRHLKEMYGDKAIKDIKLDKNGLAKENFSNNTSSAVRNNLILATLGVVGLNPSLVATPIVKTIANTKNSQSKNELISLKNSKSSDIITDEEYNEFLKEIRHHGILGQKWGVRRYQNKDGSLTELGKKRYYPKDNERVVVSKGARLASVSLNLYKKDWRSIYTYNPQDQHDTDVYKGAFSTYLKRKGQGTTIYETTFVANKDLVSPSKKERQDVFYEVYKESPELYKKVVNDRLRSWKDTQNAGVKLTEDIEKASKANFITDKSTEKEIKEAGYRAFFSASGVNSQNPYMSLATAIYYDKLESKGFNALLDDNNAYVYNYAHTPLIVLDSVGSLYTEKVRKVTEEEYKTHLKNINEFMSSKGKNIAL